MRLPTLNMDFRGPLHDCLMILDVLIKDMTEDYFLKFLKLISSRLYLMLSVIDDYIDFKQF